MNPKTQISLSPKRFIQTITKNENAFCLRCTITRRPWMNNNENAFDELYENAFDALSNSAVN